MRGDHSTNVLTLALKGSRGFPIQRKRSAIASPRSALDAHSLHLVTLDRETHIRTSRNGTNKPHDNTLTELRYMLTSSNCFRRKKQEAMHCRPGMVSHSLADAPTSLFADKQSSRESTNADKGELDTWFDRKKRASAYRGRGRRGGGDGVSRFGRARTTLEREDHWNRAQQT